MRAKQPERLVNSVVLLRQTKEFDLNAFVGLGDPVSSLEYISLGNVKARHIRRSRCVLVQANR
jgi:hypothetical protein